MARRVAGALGIVGALAAGTPALGQPAPAAPPTVKPPPTEQGPPAPPTPEQATVRSGPAAQEAALYGGVDLGMAPDNPRPPTGTPEEIANARPGELLKAAMDKFAADTNMRFALANTLLTQQATGGPGQRTTGGGDLDLWAKWTAIGAGTKDTGLLAFAGEYRYQIGDLTPSALGGQIGTLLPTTNGFNERSPTVKELYWDQRLFDDRFRYAIGRIDPENLFGGHRLQSANTFFLYKGFSSNPTVAFPGSGLAVAAQIKPVPWFYLTAGFTNANGKTTASTIESFFTDGQYLSFAEMGVTPTIEGLGTGRYRLAIWHIDARPQADEPSDQGFTLSFDQDLGKSLIAFLRYGHADGAVTNVTNSVQGGVGITGVLGEENLLGVAAAWSQPFTPGLRDEKVLEVFQRFQITDNVQFTIDAEVIFDPSNAPDVDVVGVFSGRLRVSF